MAVEREWTIDSVSAARLFAELDQPGSDAHAPAENADSSNHASAEGLPGPSGFRIHGKVGGGASGEVLEAVHNGSDRRVALKIMRARLGSGTAASRAMRELELLSQLRIPCVPRLIDYGVWNGCLFIATEFAEGRALSVLDRKLGSPVDGPSLRSAVVLVRDLCAAVAQLHEKGIIHRDIKPSNVIVAETGEITVIDLGLAVLDLERADNLSVEGVPIGTPAFMSPEQARGESAEISTRSDVFSIGACAYFVLTGQTPFANDPSVAAHLHRVGHGHPRPLREIFPTIPRELGAVLSKACARNAQDRYSNAAELRDDLGRWLDRRPVLACEPTTWARVAEWGAVHPGLATLMTCGLIAAAALMLTFAGVYWINAIPVAVQVDQPRSRVTLTARSGAIVREWSGPPGSFGEGPFLLHPPGSGARSIVVVPSRAIAASGTQAQAGEIAAYDLHDPFVRVWSSGNRPPLIQLPTETSRRAWAASGRTELYRTVICFAANVFDGNELEGEEIVAVHQHYPYSPSAIRVYRSDGSVLYEAWHDGFIRGVVWDSASGVLVAGGWNSEVDPVDRVADPSLTEYPIVVFALRPLLNEPAGWISTPSCPGEVEPVFYKAIVQGTEMAIGGTDGAMIMLNHIGVSVGAAVTVTASACLRFDPQGWSVRPRGANALTGTGLTGHTDLQTGEFPQGLSVVIEIDATGTPVHGPFLDGVAALPAHLRGIERGFGVGVLPPYRPGVRAKTPK